MGFLQQRYDAAVSRYRQAVADYRANVDDSDRISNLKSQVLSYRRRCRLMLWALLIGLVAAILLIGSLICGALDAIVPKVPVITFLGIAGAISGLSLVIVAAIMVIVEGVIVGSQINDELRDIPDLAEQAGERAGR